MESRVIAQVAWCSLGIVAESYAIVAAFFPESQLPISWVECHVIAACLWIFSFMCHDAAGRRKDPLRPVFFGALLCAVCFPFVGPMLAVALLFAHASVEQVAMYEDEAVDLSDLRLTPRSRAEYRSIVRDSIDFESYVDILAGIDRALKIKVVSRLAGIKDPTAVRVLRASLHDPDPEVRLYASSAMFKLEVSYHQELSRASKDMQRRGLLRDRIRYADACRAYADAGLVDTDAAMHHRAIALEEYLFVCKSDPSRRDAAFAAVMLLIEMGRCAHASAIMPVLEADAAMYHAAQARLAFEQGHTDEVALHAALAGEQIYFTEEVRGFWCP
jgi:hypothetical protein